MTVPKEMPRANERPTLTVDETAYWLRWNRNSVYRACKDGTLTSIRNGRHIYVVTADLRRFVGLAD